MLENVSRSSVEISTNSKGDATVTVKLYSEYPQMRPPAQGEIMVHPGSEAEGEMLSRAVVETYTGTIRKLRLHHVNVAGSAEYGDEVSKQHQVIQEARHGSGVCGAYHPRRDLQCKRTAGHTGDHLATNGNINHGWSNSDAKATGPTPDTPA